MGKPKESLPIAGNTLLGRIVDELMLCTYPVIVLARDGEQDLPPLTIEAEIAYDSEPGAGPMAALRDALRLHQGRSDAVLVVGCDFPFLDGKTVGWLAEHLGDHDSVVPSAQGRLQPLLGIYRVGLLPHVEQLLRDGVDTIRTVSEGPKARVLDEAVLREFDPEIRFMHNVNDPASYQEAVARLGT